MKLFTLVFVLVFSHSLFAGLWLEPEVGYQIKGIDGQVTFTDTNGVNNFDYASNGLFYGGRIGYKMLGGILVALEYRRSSNEDDTEIDTLSASIDTTQSTTGATLGFVAPLGLRLWATYIFSSELEADLSYTSGAVQSYEFDGSGYRLGFGYTFGMILGFNVTYSSISYDEGTFLTNSTRPITPALDSGGVSVSISIPLDI